MFLEVIESSRKRTAMIKGANSFYFVIFAMKRFYGNLNLIFLTFSVVILSDDVIFLYNFAAFLDSFCQM